MEYFEKIKELRIKKGLTQQKLAELTGYNDRSSIAKIESGSVDIPQSKLELFAKVLGCSPAYLMGWKDDDSSEPYDPLKNANWDKVADLIDSLSPEELDQLINYGNFLLSQKEK